MTRKEAVRQNEQTDRLMSLGFTRAEAEALRRISMTLHRWFELECGDSNDYASWAIERDDDEAEKPYMVRHLYAHGQGKDRTIKTPIADRETGARKRLKVIIDRRNARITDPDSKDAEQNIHAASAARLAGPVVSYIQTDPRGASLYIVRPGDVPEGKEVDAYYNNGVCIW